MPVTLPRSGALPLSSTGIDLYSTLLGSLLGGALRSALLLYIFPISEYHAAFYISCSLVYCGGILLPKWRHSASVAATWSDLATSVEAQEASNDFYKTVVHAVGFVGTWVGWGPGRAVVYWVVVVFLVLWGGMGVIVGLKFGVMWLEKRTEWRVVAFVGKGLGEVMIWWYKALIYVLNTVLYGIEDATSLIHTVRCFVLPWGLRRMGERFEVAYHRRRKSAVQVAYEYEKLDHTKKQIRLLRIPRQPLFWGHLRCTLITASMDDLPPFEALSYRWAFSKTPDQTELILVNGHPLKIPSSAYQLLHACSSLWTDRLVWIDAICINQADAVEKSHQIPLMRDIYSKASRVILWPGDEADSGMGMSTIQRVLSATVMFQAPDEEMRDFFADEWDRRAWRAMTRLFEDPYFTRMWVIQEVVCGSNVEMHHGGHTLSWDIFALVALQCIQPRRRAMLYGPTPVSLARERTLNEAMEGIGLMALFRVAAEAGILADLHIGHLLFATAKSQASDPRDKVFALSGLLSGKNALPASLLDYTKPAAKVFLETAKIVLEQDRDPFALLGFAGIGWHADHSPDLPSWAVDWSKRTLPTPFSEGHHYIAALLGQGQRPPTGPTGQSPTVQVLTAPSPPRLLVRGAIIDRIRNDVAAVDRSAENESTTSHVQVGRGRSNWYLNAEKLLQDQLNGGATYPYTGQPLREAFWRTVVADRSGAQQPAPAYFVDCNKVYRQLSLTRLKVSSNKSQHDADKPLRISDHPELRAIWPTGLEEEAQFHEFSLAIGRAAENRKFVVGERGLLGLAPPLSRPGDFICLFDGAPTPFVLRERMPEAVSSERGYDLVGECYAHGLMGDVEWVRERHESRTFTVL